MFNKLKIINLLFYWVKNILKKLKNPIKDKKKNFFVKSFEGNVWVNF